MSKGVALCLAVILKVSVLSNLNEMLQKRSYKEDTDMLKKSLFSYHKLLNNTLYLYNSLKGSNSLTKITNPDMINWINKMINSGNYYDGNSNIIQLLQEIEFIKDISIKEEKKQRRLKRIQIETSADLFLTIMPTTNCNFRCAYCYEEYEPKIMSEITQQNLINFVVKKLNRCRNLFVNWFGGEPLLAIDTIKSLSSEFIKITHALKKGYLASMTTNGYLLTPETVKDFLRYKIVDYQITLEHAGDIEKDVEKEMKLTYSSSMGRYYEHARLIAEATTPKDASVKLLATDGVTKAETDIIQSGWGDPQGYKIGGKDVSQTLNVRALFSEVGDYSITLKLIDRDNSDTVIAQKTFEYKVAEKEVTPPEEEKPSQPEITPPAEETEQPTQKPDQTTTETKTNETVKQETPNKLPKTGYNEYVIMSVVLFSVIGLGIYINKKK